MDQHATTVLLACLGYAGDAKKTERLIRVQPDEWRAVAKQSRQHGIAPLLHHLNRLGIALPGDVAEELKQIYRQNVMRNLQLYHELCKLLLLQEKGIAVVALKGAHLAAAVYDNIGLRTMADIDLLARKDDLLRVEQELLGWGYDPYDYNRVVGQGNKHFCYTLPKTGPIMEIHWTIIAAGY